MATAPATPINQGWTDVHAPEMFTFERENDTLVGEYLGSEEVNVKGKPATQYLIKCGDGKIRTFLSTYDLSRKMVQIPAPSAPDRMRVVRIVYEGEDHTIQTQGSPMRKFKVSWK